MHICEHIITRAITYAARVKQMIRTLAFPHMHISTMIRPHMPSPYLAPISYPCFPARTCPPVAEGLHAYPLR
jgi:hypothetical protein